MAVLPSFEDGAILPVVTSEGEFLGQGYFNRRSSIVGRMLTFDETPVQEAVAARLREAVEFRMKWFEKNEPQRTTNAYRVVHSEGDGLPGLIVDRYADHLVLQITTLGMDRLKPFIVEQLVALLQPKSIYEKSTASSRREEGLERQEGLLMGEMPSSVEILENGLKFQVEFEASQKTGFFLDQREMRSLVETLAQDRVVLNAFAYTGGFSVYALCGGAKHVDSVDISADAMAQALHNMERNAFSSDRSNLYTDDAFDFLKHPPRKDYDFIILDPPAFAKKKSDVVAACRGYKELNRMAFSLLSAGGLLLTCSCSYHVDEKLFQTVLFQAAREANRRVRIVQRHHLAPDHPVNLYHPEGEYLKSMLLVVE